MDAEVAARLLDRFTDVGLVDDAEYARMLVRSQRESRGLARRGLAAELRRRGVGAVDAEAALAEVEPEDEESTARALLERRLRQTAGLEPQARARRAMGMLARKGYPPALASRLVREAIADEGTDAWHPGAPDTD